MKGLFSTAQTLTYKLLNEGKRPDKLIKPSFRKRHFDKYSEIEITKREKGLSLTERSPKSKIGDDLKRIENPQRGLISAFHRSLPKTRFVRAYLPLSDLTRERFGLTPAISEGIHVGHNRTIGKPINEEHANVIGILTEMLDITSQKPKGPFNKLDPRKITSGHAGAWNKVLSLEQKKMDGNEIFAVALAVAKKNPKTIDLMNRELDRLSKMSSKQRIKEISQILKMPKREIIESIKQLKSLV